MAAGKSVCQMLFIFLMVLVFSRGEEENQNLNGNILREVKTRSQVDSSLVLLEVVYLRRDLRTSEKNILEKLENAERERQTFEEQMQSQETNQNEELKRLNNVIESQKVDILGLQKAIDDEKNRNEKLEDNMDNLTAAYQDLMTAFTNFKKKSERELESIVNDVCKARSVEMPNTCNTAGCCLKSVFENYDKCFPSCSGKCPAGYDLYKEGHFCYKFHSECTDWSSARTICQKEGGDLIVLKDDKAVSYFIELAKKNFGGCKTYGPWLGASDAAIEGDWRWIDGTKVVMSKHWIPGQPKGGRKENYLHIHSLKYMLFNDAPHGLGGTSFLCAIQ